MSNALALANLLEDICGLSDDHEVAQIIWKAKHDIENYVSTKEGGLSNHEKQLVLEDRSLDAIKSYRNRTSSTLMVAKSKVDEYKTTIPPMDLETE